MDFIARRYLIDDMYSFLRYKGNYHDCFEAQCILFENIQDEVKYDTRKLEIIGKENNQIYKINKDEFDKWKTENEYCISKQMREEMLT